jgi:ferric-dicitrate binding protein FerR (iron transport regulator)
LQARRRIGLRSAAARIQDPVKDGGGQGSGVASQLGKGVDGRPRPRDDSSMMRNIHFAVAASLLLSFAFFGCAPRAKPAETAAAPASQKVTVVYTEGSVSVNGSSARIGQTLGTTVSVETGPSSTCQIEFGDKNIMSVGQNAVASFDFSKITAEVELKKGGLTSVLKGLAKIGDRDSFVVKTDAASAGVRGTCFCVWCDDTSTYVCACNGTVRTIDAKGHDEQTLTASHHVARLYTIKGDAISVEAAGLLHHSDASVQALASKIGYTVDWSKAD